MFHYHPKFKANYKVKWGMYDYLERMGGDIDEISKNDAQIESFKRKSGFFSSQMAQRALKMKTPSHWWE